MPLEPTHYLIRVTLLWRGSLIRNRSSLLARLCSPLRLFDQVYYSFSIGMYIQWFSLNREEIVYEKGSTLAACPHDSQKPMVKFKSPPRIMLSYCRIAEFNSECQKSTLLVHEPYTLMILSSNSIEIT